MSPSSVHGSGLPREITPLRQKTLKELAPERERERGRRKRWRDKCVWNVGGPVGVNNIVARR